MSLTTIVTVHCDECGHWVHPDEHPPRTRRRRGWIVNQLDAHGRRRDYCPSCAAARQVQPATPEA